MNHIGMVKVKVKSAYEPSGPSGRSLSWFHTCRHTSVINSCFQSKVLLLIILLEYWIKMKTNLINKKKEKKRNKAKQIKVTYVSLESIWGSDQKFPRPMISQVSFATVNRKESVGTQSSICSSKSK